MKPCLAGIKQADLILVDIDPDNLMTDRGHARGMGSAQVTTADHSHPHRSRTSTNRQSKKPYDSITVNDARAVMGRISAPCLENHQRDFRLHDRVSVNPQLDRAILKPDSGFPDRYAAQASLCRGFM